MTISERVKNINPSQTLAITAQTLKMKREGKKVISFGAGEPEKDNKIEYKTSEIMVSTGAKQCFFNALLTICNPGDEVLLPIPCCVSYTEQIKFTQAVPVFVPTHYHEAFKLNAKQVEEKITPRTKLIILNSPNNPT